MCMSEENDKRLRSAYRWIRLRTEAGDERHGTDEGTDDTAHVSFDTVPRSIGESSYGFDRTAFSLSHTGKSQVLLHGQYSLDELSQDNLGRLPRLPLGYVHDKFTVDPQGHFVRSDYPSASVLNNETLLTNRSVGPWSTAWKLRLEQINSRLADPQSFFKYFDKLRPPEERRSLITDERWQPLNKEGRRRAQIISKKVGFPPSPRTFVCYINGRAHTWVTIDWVIRRVVNPSDHLVIVTNLPRITKPNKPETNQGVDEWLLRGYSRDQIREVVDSISTYVKAILNPNLPSLKFTVQVMLGKTKNTLINAINEHKPDFIVVSTLVWERDSNLVSWKSRRLVDVLCTMFPIPVIVVPAKRLYRLELELQDFFNSTSSAHKSTKSISSVDSFMDLHSKFSRYSPISSASRSIGTAAIRSISNSSDMRYEETETNLAVPLNVEESFSEGFEGLPMRTKLVIIERANRRNDADYFQKLDSDQSMTEQERNFKKVAQLIRTSVGFAIKVEECCSLYGNEESGFQCLRRFMSGTSEPVSRRHSNISDMTDIGSINTNESKGNQIRFSEDSRSPNDISPSGNTIARRTNSLDYSRVTGNSIPGRSNEVSQVWKSRLDSKSPKERRKSYDGSTSSIGFFGKMKNKAVGSSSSSGNSRRGSTSSSCSTGTTNSASSKTKKSRFLGFL